MMIIGSFKLAKTGGWEGTIRTLTINEKVRLVPNDDRMSANAPAFRVMLGWRRIGDAWEAKSDARPPRDYLRLRIDDPAFAMPLRVALLINDDGGSARLIWNRHTSNLMERNAADET